MAVEEFQRVCDRFTNRRLFVSDNAGRFVRDKHGSLVKTNYDNA